MSPGDRNVAKQISRATSLRIRSRSWLKIQKENRSSSVFESRCQRASSSFQSENTCRQDCKVDQENRGLFTSEGAQTWHWPRSPALTERRIISPNPSPQQRGHRLDVVRIGLETGSTSA